MGGGICTVIPHERMMHCYCFTRTLSTRTDNDVSPGKDAVSLLRPRKSNQHILLHLDHTEPRPLGHQRLGRLNPPACLLMTPVKTEHLSGR